MPTKNDVAGVLRLARRADEQSAAQKQRAADLVAEAVALGATWAEVGAAFGVTRQAAHERFSPANRRRRRVTPVSVATLCDTTSIGKNE